MLPSEARENWISYLYDSNTVQNWITHHPNPQSPNRVHLLGRITGRIGLQRIFSIWAHEVDPFCKLYLKHQEITLRIQRNKGNAGHKMSEVSKKASNLEGLQQGFSSWQFQDSVLLSWAFLPMELPNVTALSTSPLQPQPGGFKTKFPWTTPKQLGSLEYQA